MRMKTRFFYMIVFKKKAITVPTSVVLICLLKSVALIVMSIF